MNTEHLDKMPAHDEAERLVLGCVMLDNGLAPQVLHDLNPDDFISESRRYVFAAMRELDRRNKAIDPLTVQEELTLSNTLEKVGGLAFVASLIDGCPRFSNVSAYVRMIKDASLRRQAMRLASWLFNEAQADDRRLEEVLATLSGRVESLQDGAQVDDLIPSTHAAQATMQSLEKRWESGQEIIGMSTGFSALDRILLGLRPGKYYVLAAGTGGGKTTLALNFADNVLTKIQDGVRRVGLLISLEMSVEELNTKLFSTHTRLDSYLIETGKLPETDKQAVREAAKFIGEHMAIEYVEGFSKVTAQSILSRVHKVKRKHGRIDFLIVDYLQLLDADKNYDSEHSKLSEISRTLKRISLSLGIPVIVLSQLNRNYANRTSKDFELPDLRGSGSIEQDADVVMFLMPQDWAQPDSPQMRLKIAKNRGGRNLATVPLVFFKNQSRFELGVDPAEVSAMPLEDGYIPKGAGLMPTNGKSKRQADLDDYYSYI